MSTPNRSATPRDWTLPELFACAGVQAVDGRALPNVKVTSLTDDSRRMERGACHVAIRGTGVDGHEFVGAAVDSGAATVVVDRDVSVPGGTVCIRVEDSREALARLASAYYGLRGDLGRDLRLVGITGTNGKTTVAWLLRSILNAAGHRTAMIGTIEYDLITARLSAPLTTPGPLDLCRHIAAAREAGAAFGVLEVSSHALDQRRCDGLPLTAAVFTNLSGDHLDYHGTMESYGRAKRRLFDLLDVDGIAVVNHDDPMGKSLLDTLTIPVIPYALDTPEADVRARIEAMSLRGSDFVLKGRSFDTMVRMGLIGRHNIVNAVAAAATAEALGVAPEAIKMGLEEVAGVPGRLQRAEPEGCPFSVLVDYAHTDAALGKTLEALRPLTRGRLICVFGCGGDRDRSKRPRMGAAVSRVADIAYVTSDNPRREDPQAIINEIVPGFGLASRCRVEVQVDRRRAIAAAVAEARSGDTVLIAGKGHETYQLVNDRTLDFDDVDVARSCLTASSAVEEVA